RRIIPNIAESFTVSDDVKEYTFTFRKGMKWSDGEPLTADDVLFWYEDVFMNKQLSPSYPLYLTSGVSVK
ncbi:MAG: ABC transporter substrate-binding protein, partial [Nocardioidaceae bacterium]